MASTRERQARGRKASKTRAAKKAPKTKRAKTKRAKTKKAPGKRHENAHCKGDCRIRTKGMKVGDVRRRISKDGKKLKIERVG